MMSWVGAAWGEARQGIEFISECEDRPRGEREEKKRESWLTSRSCSIPWRCWVGEVMETQSERPDKTTVKTPARAAERKKTLLSALGALGFSKAEARERASEVLERVSDRAESMPVGDLIKEAFRRSA